MQRGICLAHNWQDKGERGYGSKTGEQTINHLSELGASWVSITPFGWMESVKSTRIKGEHLTPERLPAGAETSARVRDVIHHAHKAGLKVMLKPHVWISGGKWRGDIAPDDWKAWWNNYRAFILHYAALAQDLKVDSFVMGVELVSAVRDNPDEVLRTIKEIRQIYAGQITYSANWDEEVPDRIWLAMDAIGTQLYPPLSSAQKPSVDDLRGALRPHLSRWHELGAALDRPVLLTEVGYKSAPTAVSEPFGWPEHLPDHEKKSDEALQALAYRALLSELPEHPQVKGLFLWKYFTDPNTDEEGPWGFSPRGKRAEEVIRAAFAQPKKL